MTLNTIDHPTEHGIGPKPQARLMSYTNKPLETMWYAWAFAKNKTVPSLPPRDELVSFFQKAVTDWMPITEFVHFTFACVNIPRALLDQMTRHRLWSFFVQSLRVADMSHFAEEAQYFTPDAVCDNNGKKFIYDCGMSMAEHTYRALLAHGVPLEDARGVLPLHANTRLMVGFNLRAFQQAVEKRTCLILQQQYWAPLLASMRDELINVVDPALEFIFRPPCELRNHCITKIEQEERLAGRDPNPPCPKYDATRLVR